jgi:hypothetical protein
VSYRAATTTSGAQVRLHDDVLKRILRKHSELNGMEGLILEAVASPDLVLMGHDKELLAVKHYERTPFGAKDMVVVYREDKHLVITAFLISDRVKLVRKRTVLWQRQSK